MLDRQSRHKPCGLTPIDCERRRKMQKEYGYPFDKPIESFDSVPTIMKLDGAAQTDIELVEYLLERIRRLECRTTAST